MSLDSNTLQLHSATARTPEQQNNGQTETESQTIWSTRNQ